MASGYPGGGGGPEFYGVGGRSMPGGPMNSGNNINPQIPGIFLDQIGNRISSGNGKRTLADFQAAQQQQQSFHNQAAINAFLLRSVKPRTFQSPAIDMSSFGGSSQRYVSSPFLPNLRYQQTQQQSDYMALTGVVPCIEPVQNLNRVEESSENMLNSLRELEKQLLDDEGGDDDVSVITHSNSDWLHGLMTPNPNPNPVLSSSSPSSSSSSSSPSTASTTTSAACSRQTVLEIATAIAEGKTEIASEILARVSQTPSQRRNSEEKLVDFMVTALRSRINPAAAESSAQLYGKEHINSTQLLYELSPCFKLGFMAANLAILDANDDATSFHVVDFEIGEGGQYFNLLHALSTRRSGKNPPVVKITAVTNVSDGFSVAGGDRGEGRLKTVGDRLSELGDRLGISLKFNVVAGLRLSGLSRESLGCDPDEPLAVNLAFKLYRVPDESVCMENPRDELLRRVKGLNPSVVTLVEEEMNSNTAPFLGRVSESCACYGALLDSVESTVPSSNSDRARVEEGIGRKLINAVACEGIDRVERCEVFGKWRMRMSMAGFELMPVSEKIAEAMKSRLSNGNRVHPGFTVKEENGGVCFGWMGRTLAVASAWR